MIRTPASSSASVSDESGVVWFNRLTVFANCRRCSDSLACDGGTDGRVVMGIIGQLEALEDLKIFVPDIGREGRSALGQADASLGSARSRRSGSPRARARRDHLLSVRDSTPATTRPQVLVCPAFLSARSRRKTARRACAPS